MFKWWNYKINNKYIWFLCNFLFSNRDVAFFQKLIAYEVDIQVMSEVLIQQKEKVNDILQTFANFGNQTQDTILNNEQIKKKETERITYFENYLTEFEKSFSLMEINLRKSLQERENILQKLHRKHIN